MNDQGNRLAGTSTADRAVPLPAAKHRVLVVDDNAGAAKMLGLLIRTLGDHEIRLAHDGHAAVEQAREFRPHLVLLDIGLPGMDGYDVAESIRNEPELNATMLVAVTGYDASELESRNAKFDAHIMKPASIDEIQRLLEVSRSHG